MNLIFFFTNPCTNESNNIFMIKFFNKFNLWLNSWSFRLRQSPKTNNTPSNFSSSIMINPPINSFISSSPQLLIKPLKPTTGWCFNETLINLIRILITLFILINIILSLFFTLIIIFIIPITTLLLMITLICLKQWLITLLSILANDCSYLLMSIYLHLGISMINCHSLIMTIIFCFSDGWLYMADWYLFLDDC